MVAVYVGKNVPGSSMYLVGKQICDLTGASLCTTIGESMKGHDVISLVLEDTPKLVTARKFIGVGSITLFLAANWEEYGLWDRAGILAFATQNNMVVHSKHSLASVRASASSLLSPAAYKAVVDNVKFIPYGVSSDFTPTHRNPLNWIVPYNRINTSQKNMPLHSELSFKLKVLEKSGKLDHLFIVNQDLSAGKTLDLSSYRVVKQPATREEYMQLIAHRGAFLCTSNYESFGIYYLELLCSGCVGVFVDRPWIHALLPGYPLLASSKVEAVAMMGAVIKNYTNYYDSLLDTWIPFIRETYDLQKFSDSIVSLASKEPK